MTNEEFDDRMRDLLTSVRLTTDDHEPLSMEHVFKIRRRVDALLRDALTDAIERIAYSPTTARP